MKIKRQSFEEMTWKQLKDLAVIGQLPIGTEITFDLKNGVPVTATVYGILPAQDSDQVPGVRFLFDTAVDLHCMNPDWTNRGGYYASACRRHVVRDIMELLPDDMVDYIRPRKITETLRDAVITYSDPLWLPSETDIFGKGDDSWQNGRADGPDDFQLSACLTDCKRVITLGGEPAWAWLRSVSYDTSDLFLRIYTDGTINDSDANYSGAVAPGFDF